MKPASNSQNSAVTLKARAQYIFGLTKLHIERLRRGNPFDNVAEQVDFYRTTYSQFAGKDLKDGRVLEIGYGQRPFRLMAMQSLGYDTYGVDLDQPLSTLSLSSVSDVFVKNGPVRGMKSLARRIVFDGAEYGDLAKMLQKRFGVPLNHDHKKLLVGDAAGAEIWQRLGGKLDFIYSEDVFEHIPVDVLPKLVAQMREYMADDGVAVITPNVFTGIAGGHDLGWYMSQANQDLENRGPAWGHLTGETPPADTFLNKMKRTEYRELFSKYFTIEHEEALLGDLGLRHFTSERQALLKDYSHEELFSNRVRFVLRKTSN